MQLTFIGMIQLVLGGLVILVGRPGSTLVFLLFSALFEGSAALVLPALGGSTVPPVQFALPFVLMRIFAPKGGLSGYFPDALRANLWLALFCFYGVALSYLGPRLFGGTVNVAPMKTPMTENLFFVVPLAPTTQNLNAGIYMTSALLLALCAYILARCEGAQKALVSASIGCGWFLIATGLLDVAGRGTPIEDFLKLFRNGNYEQMSAEVDGMVRIAGIMPESSTYAGACFVFLMVNAEMWYRSIAVRSTAPVALALMLMLVLSTSSTAYVALASYAAFFILRALLLPGLAPRGKLQETLVLVGAAVFLAAVAMAILPRMLDAVSGTVLSMTVEKSASSSGQQRLFWAGQGLTLARATFGIGVGPGSFRSSSNIMAILGSMGVIGILSYILYLLAVFQPARRSSYGLGDDAAQTLGGALASAAILGLIPAAVTSPIANPAATFSLLAGAALAIRPARPARRKERSAAAGERAAVPAAIARRR
ncbi:glycoside hydrolase [Novosphingobium flavum]|uniref:Glycoside hydrolase n=1 Tax=Novosphingobium flavum TaxID=1778672 RepID=A0A7X1FRF1_9SPHN|nr:glycoside hydrolase [Novosphingobium flavum]MBC2665147.1 glycoside hydrolase [Novosphingobium flavum]